MDESATKPAEVSIDEAIYTRGETGQSMVGYVIHGPMAMCELTRVFAAETDWAVYLHPHPEQAGKVIVTLQTPSLGLLPTRGLARRLAEFIGKKIAMYGTNADLLPAAEVAKFVR